MSSEELVKYVRQNVEAIFHNLKNVFGFDLTEFRQFVNNLDVSFEFNDALKEKNWSVAIFSLEKLNALRDTLLKLGLNNEEIKSIIVKSPIMVLYSNKLEDLYYLYKNKKYYGYTVLDNNSYSTYLLNSNVDRNVVSNNFITDRMLEYYGVKVYDNATFDKLKSPFKLKNYYYKSVEGENYPRQR